MAAITQNTVSGVNGAVNLTLTTLGASDTLTYSSGSGQYLFFYNTTASPVIATVVGAGATTISPAGLGGTVSTASGKAITVPASGATIVKLDVISAYLVGAITITGGTGLLANIHA